MSKYILLTVHTKKQTYLPSQYHKSCITHTQLHDRSKVWVGLSDFLWGLPDCKVEVLSASRLDKGNETSIGLCSVYSVPMIHLQHSGGIRSTHFLAQLPPVHHSPTAHAALLWLGNAARYECDAPFPLANQTALDQRALTFGFIRHLREVLKRNICFRFHPKYLFQAISSAHDRLPGRARWTRVWWHRLRSLLRGSNEGLNELLHWWVRNEGWTRRMQSSYRLTLASAMLTSVLT